MIQKLTRFDPRRSCACCGLGLFLALLGGCDRPEGGAARVPGDGGAGEPTSGGTAVVALASEPDGLNPLVFSSASAGLVFAELHDGLTEMDDDLNYVPRIARSWKLDADGLGLTYFLQPWRWSDGEPLTAHDVVASYRLFVDPQVASPRRGQLKEVTGASAPDSATVHYTFARPQSEPLARTWHHILPEHVVGGLAPAAAGSWPINRLPLSTGEFLLEKWEPGRSISLVRNPAYPGRAARLERVVFRILPEASTRLLALEAGEVDLVDDLDPDAAERVAASGKARIVSVGGRRFYYLGWNFRNPAFADRDTRRALSLALDRDLMVTTLLKGYGRAAVGPVPPVLWNHHDQLEAVPHDAAAARALLAAAGWADTDGDSVLERDGVPFAFEIITKQGDPVRENAAVILRANLAEVGVKVSLRVMEHAAGLAQVRAGRYDAYLGLLNANLFGNPAAYVGSDAADQFNFGGYANAEVDSLLAVATGLLTREDALPVWLRLQEVLAADPPAAYLMYPDNLVGVSRRLQDVRPHLLSPVNNLAEWWIAPADRIYRTGS